MIEGAVIRAEADRLPSGAIPEPVWLWWSRLDATASEVDRMRQAFLRRFDIEICQAQCTDNYSLAV
ncbi:hypothetical protein [Nonomuraea sp. KM90]|uniref:hypothetical protein n=1 Tax=Nonomuraea sp. KM90 TaxID=3457428 RepID=UPI003FCDC640